MVCLSFMKTGMEDSLRVLHMQQVQSWLMQFFSNIHWRFLVAVLQNLGHIRLGLATTVTPLWHLAPNRSSQNLLLMTPV